jgi:hypothetical protein
MLHCRSKDHSQQNSQEHCRKRTQLSIGTAYCTLQKGGSHPRHVTWHNAKHVVSHLPCETVVSPGAAVLVMRSSTALALSALCTGILFASLLACSNANLLYLTALLTSYSPTCYCCCSPLCCSMLSGHGVCAAAGGAQLSPSVQASCKCNLALRYAHISQS